MIILVSVIYLVNNVVYNLFISIMNTWMKTGYIRNRDVVITVKLIILQIQIKLGFP